MTLFRLLLEIVAGLIKVFQFQTAKLDRARERDTGAALQREEDMHHEENRIRRSGGADLERLPDGPDPLDRDGPT